MLIINIYLYIILTILFTSSSLIGSEYSLSYNIVYISITALLLPIIFKNSLNLKVRKSHLLISLLLTLLSLVSSIKNEEFTLFISNLILIISFFINYYFYNYLFKSKKYVYPEFIFIIALIISISIWIISTNPASTSVYKGIYENPNTMGVFLATCLILNTGLIFGLIELKKSKYIISLAILLIISFQIFFFLTLTVSRTSILAFISTAATIYILYMMRSFSHGQIKLVIKHTILLTILLGVGLYFLPEDILEPIINKFDRKSDDTLDFRGFIWKQTFTDAGLWGQGSNYFFEKFSLGPHNTFISMLGRYGYPYAIILLIIWIWLGIKSFSYTIYSTANIYVYLPFTTWLGFSLLSITETMLFKPIMLVFFLSLSLITNHYSKRD